MPHALLLSPDDQAVSAITAVLDEMSVTCERPLDGPSAAKKLNSQSFDLVLVDCENLPAAKLIFDVCRRPTAGVNPIPIAIVDGRAGLPTAFRLGAELILTKPVAKDQARTTIRTAVNRIKKDESPHPPHLFEEKAPETAAIPPEPRASAAVAGASGSAALPTEVKRQAPKPEARIEASEPPEATMRTAAEAAIKPALSSKPLPGLARDLTPPQSFAPPKIAPPTPAPAPKPSDDPVLADMESELPTPAFASYARPQTKKGRGSIWFLLLLMLAGGGFYAAWMYQPGFREMFRPWLERGLAALHVPGQSQAKVTQQPAPAPSPSGAGAANKPPSNTSAAEPSPPVSGVAASGPAPENTNTTTSSASSTSPAAGIPVAGTPVAPVNSTVKPQSEDSEAASAEDSTPDTKKDDSKQNILAPVPSNAELPGEGSAVILSSRGAEKRLLQQVPPVYPLEARKERIEGTVVLKTVVNDAGKVAGVRVIEGNPALAPAAMVAVKQWRYRPYVRNGRAMPFQTIVLVDFQRH